MRYQLAIISAERWDMSSAENVMNTRKLREVLEVRGMNFHEALGTYDGREEDSFMVKLDVLDDLSVLLKLSDKFNQDCIFVCQKGGENPTLISERDGTVEELEGRLVFGDTRPEEGDFTQVDKLFFSVV